MRKVYVRFRTPMAIACAMLVVACGKSDSKSPVSPSASASAPTRGGVVTGATISGTILTAARASSVRPAGVALTVSIVGTSINAMVDASGHFTLQNVPSGDLTLAFMGSGIDARLTIKGVHANDQIRITVNVNGNTADLEENDHEMDNHEAELEGRVVSASCSANPQTIVVGTMTPTTVNIQTARIHRGDDKALTCAQIQLNDWVEVHGTKNGTMMVATEVDIETDHGAQHQPGNDDGDEGDKNEAEVKGIVAGAPAGHACPAFTFTVGTTTVTTTAMTKFEDTTCAEVVNGNTVEATGTRTSASALTATKVEKK